MSAVISGFVTREKAGLRKPRSISKNIAPERGGVASHWGGPKQAGADPDDDHASCIKTWLAWQKYHMDKHGWADIAYTGGYCNHGFAFAGRGIGVRTAGQGTTWGNDAFYAVVWIGGSGQKMTQLARNAFQWWLLQLRNNGKAGNRVTPHSSFKSTSCPGPEVREESSRWNNRVIELVTVPKPTTPTKPPTGSSSDAQVRRLQKLYEVTVDGDWGPSTDKVALLMRIAAKVKVGYPTKMNRAFDIRKVQGIIDTKVDGDWGPKSQTALDKWVREFQKEIKVAVDGDWGPATDGAFLRTRRRYLNNY